MNIKDNIILTTLHVLIVDNHVRDGAEKRYYLRKFFLDKKIDLRIRIYLAQCTTKRFAQDDIAQRREPYDKYLFNLKRC